MISFNRARKELLHSMKAFQSSVPDQLKTPELPTNWTEVNTTVSHIQKQWESQRKYSQISRAKAWVRKMCDGMNNHSMALKMLPSEPEYISLISGSIAMIIKVRPFLRHETSHATQLT